MIRISTKIGDVFSVKLNNKKKYFQYIANDQTQLNSDVIRGFSREYSIDESPNLSEIVKDEIGFYTHCVTKLGIKMGLWEKAGNIPEIGNLEIILFRSAADYARKAGEEPVKISNKWYVWRINDKSFTKIGKLEGVYKKACIGLIVNPYDVVDLIKNGKYSFTYPD